MKLQAPPTEYERGFLDQLDGRSSVAQVIRSQWQEMTDDLGGAPALSVGQKMLIERALWMHFWLRREEQKLADGGEPDMGKVAAVTNSLQGVLAKLGLKRQAIDVPDLQTFLSNRQQRKVS